VAYYFGPPCIISTRARHDKGIGAVIKKIPTPTSDVFAIYWRYGPINALQSSLSITMLIS